MLFCLWSFLDLFPHDLQYLLELVQINMKYEFKKSSGLAMKLQLQDKSLNVLSQSNWYP